MIAPRGSRVGDASGWWLAALLGIAVGGLAFLAPAIAAGAATVAAVAAAFWRSGTRAEIVVGAYWLAFTLYETVFADVTISGFFYPFYAAFLAAVVIGLLRDGIRVHVPLFLSYAAFLVVVATSFVGFEDPIDFDVVQRLLAYLMGGILLLQFRSRRGLRPVAAAAVVASVVISGWVIVSSIQGGFRYRGDIGGDQNVVAFFIGFGVIAATCLVLAGLDRPRRWGRLVLPTLAAGVSIYGSLLLASRGMTLALGLALLAVLAREVVRDRRAIGVVVAFAALAGGAMLLPGGQGLLERFEGERVETGGSRLPIWEATLEGYTEGDLRSLAIGEGWGASRDLVRREIGWVASTHNAWLQVLYEFGLLGLALFAWLHLHAILRAWRLPRPWGPLMAGLTWFLVFANFSTNAPDGFMYWVVLATVFAIGTWVAPEGSDAPAAPERVGPERASVAGRPAAAAPRTGAGLR